MKNEIIKKIEQKTGISNIVELLSEQITGSELNSLLLEVFNGGLSKILPALLLKQYQANRFVHPAETDMIGLLSMEIETLKFLRQYHFQPIELSPVAQIGSCAVVGPVDQKKIFSAMRNTEVMADATNALALHISDLKKSGSQHNLMRFCTVHRHVRCQPFKEKGFSPHFKVGCMVTSDRDTGSYEFETTKLLEQLTALKQLFVEVYGIDVTGFKLLKRDGYENSDRMFETVFNFLTKNGIKVEAGGDEVSVNNYYKGIQFKMIIQINDLKLEIADGGFVDWTQQLLGNKKERMLISGFGLGLLYQLQNQ